MNLESSGYLGKTEGISSSHSISHLADQATGTKGYTLQEQNAPERKVKGSNLRSQRRLWLSKPTRYHSGNLPWTTCYRYTTGSRSRQPGFEPGPSSVQKVGVEPTRRLKHQGLSLACLPFHHFCLKSMLVRILGSLLYCLQNQRPT